MKKPDRFERIANKVTNRYIGTYVGGPEHEREIAKLLRAEHAWVWGMVKSTYETAREMELSKQGFKDLIIEQLRQRRK